MDQERAGAAQIHPAPNFFPRITSGRDRLLTGVNGPPGAARSARRTWGRRFAWVTVNRTNRHAPRSPPAVARRDAARADALRRRRRPVPLRRAHARPLDALRLAGQPRLRSTIYIADRLLVARLRRRRAMPSAAAAERRAGASCSTPSPARAKAARRVPVTGRRCRPALLCAATAAKAGPRCLSRSLQSYRGLVDQVLDATVGLDAPDGRPRPTGSRRRMATVALWSAHVAVVAHGSASANTSCRRPAAASRSTTGPGTARDDRHGPAPGRRRAGHRRLRPRLAKGDRHPRRRGR